MYLNSARWQVQLYGMRWSSGKQDRRKEPLKKHLTDVHILMNAEFTHKAASVAHTLTSDMFIDFQVHKADT